MSVQSPSAARKVRWAVPAPCPRPGPHARPYRRRRPETTSLYRIVQEHLETYLCVVDGLFEKVEPATEGADATPANPDPQLRFHEATALSPPSSSASSTRSAGGSSATWPATASWNPTRPRTCSDGTMAAGCSPAAREPGEHPVALRDPKGAGVQPRWERPHRGHRPGWTGTPPALLRPASLRPRVASPYCPPPSTPTASSAALRFLDRLAKILPPPRLPRHRYHGVFAPNAPLRPLVTERAHQDNVLAAQNLPDQIPLPSPTGTTPRPKSPQDPDSPPPSPRPSRWAALLARIYETFPLTCPTCAAPLTFIALLTDPQPIAQILAHTGEPSSPPRLHPARGPPQAELTFALGVPNANEVAQDFPPDDLDPTPPFDPTQPDPIPDDDFDQSRGD